MFAVRSAQHRFSIVTACLPTRADHLGAAARSVHQARARIAPLRLEWIVVFDGPGLSRAPGAEQVIVLPKPGGTSIARNAALAVAGGDLVSPLDADDELESAALIRSDLMMRDCTLDWVAGNRVLLDSGAVTPHWHGERIWAPGELAENWTAPLAFHPNSLIARTEKVLAQGGWPALAVNEDLLLALSLSEAGAGASITEVLTRYRVWSGQEVSAQTYPDMKVAAFVFIEKSINEIRNKYGRSPVKRPLPGGACGTKTERDTQ
jgi:glycosyltransferase involved in cell wall biosynthesis